MFDSLVSAPLARQPDAAPPADGAATLPVGGPDALPVDGVAAPPEASPQGARDPGRRERRTWPDIAKGVCILLVVIWHVVTKHYLKVEWRSAVPVAGVWGTLGEFLLPLRMPLFFTISGVFATSVVNRGWGELLRSRVARFAYLYTLWVIIHTVVMWYTPDFETARAVTGQELLEYLTITPTNLWYLYALAIYFLVAKTVRHLPVPLVLLAAFALAAAAGAGMLPSESNRAQVFQNLVFFLAGMFFRPWVERLASRPGVLVTAGLGAAYLASWCTVEVLGAAKWFGVWPVLSVVATAFGLVAAGLAARRPRASRWLATLGRNTLPIYVMHLPLLAVVDLFLTGPAAGIEARIPLLAVVEPALLTALLVVVCLGLHAALRAVRATWLFELPRPMAAARAARRTPHHAK